MGCQGYERPRASQNGRRDVCVSCSRPWGRYDGTKPMLKGDGVRRALRDAAGLHGLPFNDLRHTIITELAEMGVADHVLETSQSRHGLLLSGSPPSGKLLIPLNGEMSEWLKEHAWKLIPVALSNAHPHAPTHSRINDFPQQRCASDCPRKPRCLTAVSQGI
jgi:hypothetical protein